MSRSPPKLELSQDALPSQDALRAECAILSTIAAADEGHEVDDDATGEVDADHLEDDDFEFDFLDEPSFDDEPADFLDEEDEASSEPKMTVAKASSSGKKGPAVCSSTDRPPVQQASAIAPAAAAKKTGGGMQRAADHLGQANDCHSAFVCTCSIARERGQRSCLKQFTGEQLMEFHRESFGVYVSKSMTNVDVGPNAMGARIHRLMWPLRESINSDGSPDDEGRSWRIRTWKLGGKSVCRQAWERTYGATGRRYRSVYSCVQRGYGPEHNEASQQAKMLTRLMDGIFDAQGGRLTAKRSWAATWWKKILLVMDWLPNEQRIRVRGPGFLFLHKEVYGPPAKVATLFLEYKAWKGCMKQGIVDACRELPGSDPSKVKCTRSADHSNFPECTTCQTRRNRWLSAAKSPNSDPETVKVRRSSPPRSPPRARPRARPCSPAPLAACPSPLLARPPPPPAAMMIARTECPSQGNPSQHL